MKLPLFILLPAVCLTACNKEIPAEEIALQTAKTYYEQLVAGDYASFVAGTYRPDSITSAYREELETNAKMFVATAKERHRDIDSISAIRISGDTAFLKVCFSDSIKEEIVVPMINNNGVWMMK